VSLTEVEGHRGVVVCFAVSDEVDLVLPLLLLQPVLGAAMVTYAAAAQQEDDGPDQPKPWRERERGRATPSCRVLQVELDNRIDKKYIALNRSDLNHFWKKQEAMKEPIGYRSDDRSHHGGMGMSLLVIQLSDGLFDWIVSQAAGSQDHF